MLDLTHEGSAASAEGHVRSGRAEGDVQTRPVIDGAGGRMHRIDTLQQRWDAASQTAARQQWSIVPGDSMRCIDQAEVDRGVNGDADVHDADDGPTPADGNQGASVFLRRLSRPRRSVARRAEALSTVPPPEQPGDVVVEPAPNPWEVRTTYSLVEVLRGLSRCAAPFTHASQLADDLFAVSTHPSYTPSQRTTIRTGALVADQLTGLAPQVFLLQSVCKLFRILADLIEAKPITPGDILDITMLGRHLMALKRIRSPLYVNPKFAPPRQRRPTAALGIAVPRKPRYRPAAVSDATGPEAHHAAVFYGERAAGRSGSPPIWADEEVPAQTTLEFFYSEAAETEVGAEDEGRAGSGGTAERKGQSPGSAEALPESPEASPTLLDAELTAIHRIAAAIAPAPLQWTRVKSVPLRRRTDVAAQWEPFPVSAYRVRGIDLAGTSPGQRFRWNGRDYLHVDGGAVAVRELLPDEPWIVDNRLYPDPASEAERLPPLPLWKNSAGWTVQEPDLIDEPDAHGMPVADDGYVRLQRRKFIQIDGMRVETSREGIDDEATLRPFAQQLPDTVPGADAMQIIWSADGRPWIEGTHGYYRLRFDLDRQAFYVAGEGREDDTSEGRRLLVDFDVLRHRWTAVADKGANADAAQVRNEALNLRGEAPVEETSFFDRAGPSGDGRARQDNALAGVADSVPEPVEPAPERRAPRAESEDLDDAEEAVGVASAVEAESPGFPTLTYFAKQTRLEREFALFGHYARNIKKLPFLSSARIGPGASLRRKLRRGLREALFALEEEGMVPVNRMDRKVRMDFTPQVLDFRQRLRGLYPPLPKWRSMTLQEKQYEVGIMVDLAYTQSGPDMWPCLVGYCHEIADVMLNALTVPRPKLRANLLQVALVDQGGVKGTHVMLVYADDAAALSVFGDLSLRDVRFQRSRPTLSDAEFYSWLLTHRDSVLLIDAWSTTKFVDLSDARTVEAVRRQLRPNLFEAGFEVSPNLSRFQVSAVLPERPELAPRRRRTPGLRSPPERRSP